MSSTNRLFVHSAHILSSQLWTNALTLAFSVFFARSFSKEEFAVVAVFGILLSVTNIAGCLGLETTCIRTIPSLLAEGKKMEAASMIKTVVLNCIFSTTIIAFALFLSAEILSIVFFKNRNNAYVIRIIGLGVFFGSLNTTFALLGQSVKAFKETAVVNFVYAVVYCASATFLYILYGYSGWICGFVVSHFVGSVLYLRSFRKWLFLRSGLYPWRKLVRVSLPFYVRGYMRFGLLQLDQLVIGVYMQPSELATYYVARRISDYVLMIIEAVGQPIVVKIAEIKTLGKEKVRDGLSKISRYNSFIFVPLCLGLAAFGHPLLELYGGQKYLSSYPILIILCLSRMITGVWGGVYVRGVFILGRPRDTLTVDALGCFVSSVSIPILVGYLGASGVALSVFFSSAGSVAAGYLILRKEVDVLFDKAALYRSLIATGTSVVFALIMQAIRPDLFLIPGYALLSVIILLMILLRFLQEEDILILESILTKRFRFVLQILHLCGLRTSGPSITSHKNLY